MASSPPSTGPGGNSASRSLEALQAALGECMARDRESLQRLAAAVRRRQRAGEPADDLIAKLSSRVESSASRRAARAASLPRLRFTDELPVSQRREEIARAIADNQVVVICGETGSGKTTQIPKICLALGRGIDGYIGHTQPRRIAARSVAWRLAEELGSTPGEAVGYKVRFTDRVRPESYIKLMTDGILLAETQGDRRLRAYDTLIIDEAHERSLNVDFLLGYLKRLLPVRPDLRVIITSATIDPGRFARHFGGAPIIEVSGRTHPVEMRYRPLLSADEDERDRDLQQAILDAVDEVSRIDRRGDVLIFLPGEREIRDTAEALRKHHPADTEILPLFARLSAAEQQRVFRPHRGQRIVLATNVAETSLTVPGIRFVIDPGLARVSRYSYRTKVQRLPVEKISQASANQRAGRCGRMSAGVCIRLYSEEDFSARSEFTEPEILRSNLAAVILQMKHLGLGSIAAFPFVEPPDPRHVRDGLRLLEELGALDAAGELTALGAKLARLPVDPRIGRMLLEAERENCLAEVLVIAAALAIADPRERPFDARQQADASHGEFRDERSDFGAFLKLWRWYEGQRRHLSQNKQRRVCRERFLSYTRMREWRDVQRQLAQLVTNLGMRTNQVEADYDEIHRALLAGLLGNIAFKDEKNEYFGTRGNRLTLWPGSALSNKGPKWVMAAELVETNRLYARTVARIAPEWAERLAGDRVKRSYLEPHWEQRPAQVAAYEQASLYGLTLVARRKVNFGPIDPQLAREIFIRGALVQGEYASRAPFLAHNRRLIAEVEEIEHRARRRDVLVDEEVVFDFFDERIPAGVHSGRTFEKWRTQVERDTPLLLHLRKEDLMRNGGAAASAGLYPDHLDVGGFHLPLRYHFDPGHRADGVTVTVPAAALNQISAQRLEWLVPGLLRDKVIALIKSLPKPLRRHFVPAPDFADACLRSLVPGDEPLLDALAAELRRMSGVTIPAEAWRVESLPEHLIVNVRVLDAHGRELAVGRDLAALQRGLAGQTAAEFKALPSTPWEREGITAWDFGDLPDVVEVERDGLRLQAFPALVEEGEALELRLIDVREKARVLHRAGAGRLCMLSLPQPMKYLRRNLPGFQAMALHFSGMGSAEELREDLVRAVVDRAFLADGADIRRGDDFRLRLTQGRAALMGIANELCGIVDEALAAHQRITRRLKAALSPAQLGAARDIHDQLQHLVYPGFVSGTPDEWLRHLPRYLRAVELRLDKLQGNVSRDAGRAAEIARHWRRYCAHVARRNGAQPIDPAVARYRWMIEELRVSLFAQQLGTALAVSPERLDREWAQIR